MDYVLDLSGNEITASACNDEKGSEDIVEMHCELCKKKGQNRSAEGFCLDCVRYFCKGCLSYHTEFLPDHVCMDKKNMPQDVCLLPCPAHREEIIKFYCSECNTFFCSLCRKIDHKECKTVDHLPELANQLENGKDFSELREHLETIAAETRDLCSAMDHDNERVKNMSESALLKIENFKQQIIKRLDESLEKIILNVITIKEQDVAAIENDSVRITAMMSELSAMKSDIEEKLKNLKRCELFMAMKFANKKTTNFKNKLILMKKRQISKYEFETADEIEELLENALQLGSLAVKQPKASENMTSETKSMPIFKADEIAMQKSLITKVLHKPLVKGANWYTIGMKWFEQWKTYKVHETNSKTCDMSHVSAHPGPIDNTSILQDGLGKLKNHLIMDVHYKLVPEEAWVKLLSWYGLQEGQEAIARRVIEEGVYRKALMVEIYPWRLQICETSNPDQLVSKSFSRSNTIIELEQTMREEFSIPVQKEVRLWNRYMTNMYEQLIKKDVTLQDAGLYNGQHIVIEQRNSDATWPRDKK